MSLSNISPVNIGGRVSSSESSSSMMGAGLEKIVFKKIKTETLLNEEGRWNIVEKSKSYDPAEAHMKARKSVNTKSRKTDKTLAAHFDPNAKDGQDGNIRVLRMEAKSGRWDDVDDNYEVASSQVFLPKWVISQQGDRKSVVGRISSLFNGGKNKSNPIVKSEARKVVVQNASVETSQKQVSQSKIITPPKLPSRRLISHVMPVSTIAMQGRDVGDVIVPKRKPILKKSLRFPTAQDIALRGVPKPPLKPNTKSVVSYSSLQASSGAVVTQLRSGQHSGKVRLVVELSSPVEFKAGIDGVRGVLLVKVLNTDWGVSPQDNFGSNPLLGTYVARKKPDNSTLLEIRLKKKTKIIYSSMLRPNEQSQYRIVVDLEN